MGSLPHVNLVATGLNIRHIREEHGWSVAQLQQVFGFSTPQAIYKWQSGRALPTIDNLVVLSRVFDTTIETLLAIEN